MADSAFQVRYRQEFVAGFEQRMSLLRASVTTETMSGGMGANQVIFLVADSGAATAVTRGVNGLIPARADDLNQYTCVVAEWHDLVRKTRFNIFASQGNQNQIMQMTTMAVMNRKFDFDIIGELDSATNDTGTTQTANLSLVMKSRTILGNNFVPTWEADNMFAVVTPAFIGYLMQIPEFTNAFYVDVKPFASGISRPYKRWAGINWIEHPNLTGVGTSSEKCYMFHRSAIGHAVDSDTIQSPIGYNEEQDYSWARCSAFIGSKLLQNNGIVQMIHDGSAYVAT